jgi:hypothetical protein
MHLGCEKMHPYVATFLHMMRKNGSKYIPDKD